MDSRTHVEFADKLLAIAGKPAACAVASLFPQISPRSRSPRCPSTARVNGSSGFVNRRVVGSVGGGLCQLSAVIYNLALLAGLQILERHNHSIDAYGEERYIPLGCDATVAFGRKDLRFRNPHRFPVALELNVDRSQVSGSVTGGQPLDCAIRIETALIRTIASPRKRVADPEVAVGEEIVEPGLTGKVVRAWRIFERPGQSARREALSRDRYRETPTVVRYRAVRTTPWPVRVRNLFGLHG